MMKRFFIICFCFILIVAVVGCKAKPSAEADKANSVFQATIIEIKDGAMLVKPIDGYPEAEYAELINVMIQHMPSPPEPKAGDVIEITYNGIMTEENPPSPCGVEKIEIVKQGTQGSIDTPVQVNDEENNLFKGELIEIKPQCPPAYGITFRLPKDWVYEVVQSDDAPTSDLVVSIRPVFPGTEGEITLQHCDGFGVCGTGLVQKDIVFNGHEAWQGFYDGNTLWSFIALKDPKDCVIMNSAENWYEEYEEEINQILSTVEFVYYEDNTSVSEPTEQSSYLGALSEDEKQKILEFAKGWYAENFPNYKDLVFEFAKDSAFGYTQYPQYKPGEIIILRVTSEKSFADSVRSCFIKITDSGYEVFNEGT